MSTTPLPANALLVRGLSQSWDPMRGNGLGSFVSGINAVAQIISQRIKFLSGEWFENTAVNAGTPLFQQLLGHAITTQAVALILQNRILGTPFVTSILALQVVYAPKGRAFTFAAVVNTQFGVLAVTNAALPTGALIWQSLSPGQWISLTPEQWAALIGVNPGPLSWGSLTAAQFASMTASQWTTLNP